MNNSKNNIEWIKLFDKHQIPDSIKKHGFYKISSFEINKFRQARLMTKFDYRSQLPEIFSQHDLSILPISRGGYIIANFDTFQDFETYDPTITKVDFPHYLESIDYNNITSESTALNCAYVSGIIQDFVQDEELKPTVSGRMGSSVFNFNINSENKLLNIDVNNSQLEIDGGYEGVDSLSLIEAKNSISNNFLIRQMYYPYRLWATKIEKKIRPLFLTYSNGVFHFREYVFEDIDHYNSLKLIREKKYAISEGTINNELLQKILYKVEIQNEPSFPFPQSDSFERVINLCELLNEKTSMERDSITENYDFDVRQTNYYTDAGRYLGLIEKTTKKRVVNYYLTGQGKELFTLSILDRQLVFIKLILSHLVFNKVLNLYFKTGECPNREKIVELMKESNLYRIGSESTFARRASTISSWIDWILSQVEE